MKNYEVLTNSIWNSGIEKLFPHLSDPQSPLLLMTASVAVFSTIFLAACRGGELYEERNRKKQPRNNFPTRNNELLTPATLEHTSWQVFGPDSDVPIQSVTPEKRDEFRQRLQIHNADFNRQQP